MKKLVIATITTMLLASPIVSNAANCKNIRFAVNNKTGATIKLYKVRYTNVSTGKTRTEGFKNLNCMNNTICKTNRQNLRNSRNDQLNSFEFAFKVLLPGTTDWSDMYQSKTFSVNNAVCIADRQYGGGHWKIDLNPISPWLNSIN